MERLDYLQLELKHFKIKKSYKLKDIGIAKSNLSKKQQFKATSNVKG